MEILNIPHLKHKGDLQMENFKKFIDKFLAVLSVAFAIWFIVSFAEIQMQNGMKGRTYSNYNMFVLFTNFNNSLKGE